MTARVLRLLALTATSVLVLAACTGDGGATSAVPGSGSGGGAALDFAATELRGDEFAGSELVGRDTVLWFWAPWCASCRAEAPEVAEAATAFDGRVEVVGVPGKGDTAEMEAFVAETRTGGLRHLVDDDGSIWRGFGVIGQPAFAFVDDDGTVEVFNGGLGFGPLTERMAELSSD